MQDNIVHLSRQRRSLAPAFSPRARLPPIIQRSRRAKNRSVETFARRIGLLPDQLVIMESGFVECLDTVLLRAVLALGQWPGEWLKEAGAQEAKQQKFDDLFVVAVRILADQQAERAGS